MKSRQHVRSSARSLRRAFGVYIVWGTLSLALTLNPGCRTRREQEQLLELRAQLEIYKADPALYAKPADHTWDIGAPAASADAQSATLGELTFSCPRGWHAAEPTLRQEMMLDDHACKRGELLVWETTLNPVSPGQPQVLVRLMVVVPSAETDEWLWERWATKGYVSPKQLKTYCRDEWGRIQKAESLTPNDVDAEKLANGNLAQRLRMSLLALKQEALGCVFRPTIEFFRSSNVHGSLVLGSYPIADPRPFAAAAIVEEGNYLGSLDFRPTANIGPDEFRMFVRHVLGSIEIVRGS